MTSLDDVIDARRRDACTLAPSGLTEKTALVREALGSLIERERARGGWPGWAEPTPRLPTCLDVGSNHGEQTLVILVDTLVWIDHLRSGNATLAHLLNSNAVLAHPWVTGELALGNMSRRDEFMRLIQHVPPATVAGDNEVLRLIQQEGLHGSGSAT